MENVKPIIKDISFLVVYIVSVVSMFCSFFGWSDDMLLFVEKFSIFSLILILIQSYIWYKNDVRSFLSIQKILSLISLFIINLYFIFDYYLLDIVAIYFSVEMMGYILILLAIISGVVIIAQLAFFSLKFLITIVRFILIKSK